MLNGLRSWIPDPHALAEDLSRLATSGVALVRLTLEQLPRDSAAVRPGPGSNGSTGTETVDLAYRGVSYRVDLSARDAAALDTALAPYLGVARRVATPRPDTARPRVQPDLPPTVAPLAREVRAWALSEGIPVSTRGRVPADVVRRYQQARTSRP